MKEARVDEVLGRSGRKEKESKGGKGVMCKKYASGVQFRTKVTRSEVRA